MTQNKNRKKLLIWICVVLVVGALSAYLALNAVISYRAKNRLRDGIAASQAGDHVKAAELLGRYLHRYPQHEQALSYYVISREKAELPNGQHLADTLNALRTLLRINPDRMDDQKHLLELYARLQRAPEALDTANLILSDLERKQLPPDERVLELKTQELTQLHRDREALETANEWTKVSPGSLKGQLERLKIQAGVGASAASILADAKKLLEAHPDDPHFQLIMGYANIKAHDNAEAAKWLKAAEAHSNLPDDFVDALVDQYDSIGMTGDSMRLLTARSTQGGGAELRHALARREWQEGRWAEAVKLLDDVKPEDPAANITLLALKAVALEKSGAKSDALACRKALQAKEQPTAVAWALLLKHLIDGTHVDDRDIVAACKGALASDSQNVFILYYYADAETRIGELDAALPALNQAVFLDPTWTQPSVRFVDTLLQKGRIEEAFGVAVRTQKRNPSNVPAVMSLVRAWSAGVETGRVPEADGLLKLVTDIQAKNPTDVITRIIRIELLAKQGQKDEATKLLREALVLNPAPGEQLFLTLAGDSRKYGLGLEAECFAACEKARGATVALAYATAMDLLAQQKGSEGLKAFDEMAKRGINANGTPWQLARTRYLDAANDPGAKAAWVAVRDAYPADAMVQQAVVSARTLQGDRAALMPAIEHLKTITGDKALGWRLAEAKLMVTSPASEDDVEKASVNLHRLINEYPQLAEPYVLLAQALIHLKRTDAAIEQLTSASKLEQTDVQIALQLASLLQARGESERVLRELDRVTPYIHTSIQRKQVALLLTQAGASDKAMRLLEATGDVQSADGNTPDSREELLRGMIYGQRHEYAKAEEIAKKLLAHPDPSVVQFAAALYMAQGKTAEAESALHLLDTLKLEPGVKELAWGSVSAQSGDLAKAIGHYRAATVEAPKSVVAWRALLSTELRVGQLEAVMGDISAAGKALPEEKAFVALTANADLVRSAVADTKLRSVVISVLQDPSTAPLAFEVIKAVIESRRTLDRERLATELQQITEREPNYWPATSQYIQCLAAMGRVQDALAKTQHAMVAFPNDPEAAKLQVQVADASGRWADVVSGAQAWKRRAPDDSEAADIMFARAKIEQNAYEEAKSALVPYIPGASQQPERHVEVVAIYAMALLKLDRIEDAGNLLWPLMPTAVEWQVLWVQVGQDGIDAELKAVAWLDRLNTLEAGVKPAAKVALAEGYDRLGTRFKNKDLTQRSSEMFAGIVRDSTVSELVLLAAAAQAERAGGQVRAEQLYRQALSKNPHLVVADNNLAMLIVKRSGDANEAVKLAGDAVALVPESATLRDTLAQAQIKAGDSKAAAATMEQACRLEPDEARWKVRLADLLYRSGNQAAATKTLQQIDNTVLNAASLPAATREELNQLRLLLKGEKSG